jgi:ZIP family zinc transporter
MSSLVHAAQLTAFPVAAAAVGAGAAVWRRPTGTVMSAVQHFAAGVVIAALVGEILPDLRNENRWSWAIGGFVIGVGVVLALAAWGRRLDARSASSASKGSTGSGELLVVPVGMIAAVAIDLLIDGVLVGLGATLGSTQAIILTAALTIEILFLALSVQGELSDAGMSAWRAAATSAGLGLMTAVGAIGSAAALSGAGAGPIAAVLAFGAAALLYLAVEELLVEAHDEEESTVLTAMFFVGFVVIYGLAQLGA